MIKRFISAALLTLTVAFAGITPAYAAKPVHPGGGGGGTGTPNPFYVTGSVGEDVSTPNCSSTPSGSFGVVGVTGGLVYSANDCLAQEAAYFSDLSLYVNTGLNASESSPYYQQALTECNGDATCAAYHYGYNAGLDAVNVANNAGVTSNRWWLDVENVNTWNADTLLNRQSLQGEYDALIANGAAMVGAYSTTVQWNDITGSWQNGWYTWGATTWTRASQAAKYCTGHEFTGGQTLLIQFRGSLDQDYAC
jgi:hypothetical protein